eukprot:SM000093S24393  [mRNA]  locus=s93:25680:27935:- [translate_table: standard]
MGKAPDTDGGDGGGASPSHQQPCIPRPLVDTIAGAAAGAAARVVVSPLDVIKIRFQVQLEPTGRRLLRQDRSAVAAAVASKYTGVLQAAREIYREEGIRGFWRGTVPALLLVMPYTAVQFVVLYRFRFWVLGPAAEDDQRKLNPTLSFVGGALAGAAATVCSYPFDLLRTILASQGEPKVRAGLTGKAVQNHTAFLSNMTKVYLSMSSALLAILRTRGVRGLYAGLTPTLVEIVPYAGLQFGLYDLFKAWAAHWRRQAYTTSRARDDPSAELTTMDRFLSGLAAGTIAKTVCHPLDLVKKRFQVEGLVRDPRYGAPIQVKAYRNMGDAVRKIVQLEGWRGLYKGTLPSVIKAAPSAAITLVVYEGAVRWLQQFTTPA